LPFELINWLLVIVAENVVVIPPATAVRQSNG